AVRKMYVNAALDEQRGALGGFDAARRNLLKMRDQLRAAQRQARSAADAIDANRKAIQTTVTAQQTTMNQVTQPDMAPLVAQAAAARAQNAEAQGKQKFATLAAPASPTTTSAAPRGPGAAAPAHPTGGSGSGPTTTARKASTPTTSAPKPSSSPPPSSAPTGTAPPVKAGASTAVNTAKAQHGKPYVY